MDRSLTCCGNPVQKVDVAQRVDGLLFLYTNIRLRHQRNRTTVGRIVPSHLPTGYNGGLLVTAQNCSGFGILGVGAWSGASARPNGGYARRFNSKYMIQIDL